MGLMGLFKPAWMSANREKALRAVAKITAQNVLADVVKNAEDYEVRFAAVKKLTDQAALAYAAKNDSKNTCRMAAADRLTDQNLAQAVYAYVAKNEYINPIRVEAVEKLSDQNSLAYVARNDEDYKVAMTAVKKLTDQALLADIAKNCNGIHLGEICAAAAEKLTTQTVLSEVIKNEPFVSKKCRAALKNITDLSLIEEKLLSIEEFTIADGNANKDLALLMDKLNVPSILANIAKKAKDTYVRARALDKITDPAILAEIARNEPKIAGAAVVNKLTDQSVLEIIALQNRNAGAGDAYAYEAAVVKITDESVLVDIVRKSSLNRAITAARKVKEISVNQQIIKEMTAVEMAWEEECRISDIYSADSY
jgi:hypothetical protein